MMSKREESKVKIIKQSVEIYPSITNDLHESTYIIDKLNKIGRICYQSPIPEEANKRSNFIRKLIKDGHESIIEHHSLTVKFTTDRGVTHELVRHRLASFAQVSQRYVNYNKNTPSCILPVELYPKTDNSDLDNLFETDFDDIKTFFAYDVFKKSVESSFNTYRNLVANGFKPQLARAVLPNATTTEIFVTANLREWRHILKLRTSKSAHPQIRELMTDLLEKFKDLVPCVFEDIGEPK